MKEGRHGRKVEEEGEGRDKEKGGMGSKGWEGKTRGQRRGGVRRGGEEV